MTLSARVSASALAFTALFCPLTGANAPQSAAPSLSFLVVGDWGRDGKDHQQAVADQMGRTAKQVKADFVISTGDNFYNSGVTSATSPQWKSSFERVYTAPSLQVPWYVVLGNHDHRSEPLAEVEYTQHSSRWKMPARYFTETRTLADGTSVQLFFLDTQPLTENDHWYTRLWSNPKHEQLAWLEDQLQRSKAEWKFVVGHHGIHSSGIEHGNSPSLIENVQPLLERYRVQAYFNGHDHDLEHIVINGVSYFTSGAGSKTRPVERQPDTRFSLGETSGFLAATLTAAKLDARFVDETGRIRYTVTLPRAVPSTPKTATAGP